MKWLILWSLESALVQIIALALNDCVEPTKLYKAYLGFLNPKRMIKPYSAVRIECNTAQQKVSNNKY